MRVIENYVEPGFLRSDTVFPTVESEIAYARGQGSVGMADVGGVAAFKRGADGSSNVVAGLDATWGDGVDRITGHLVDSATRQPAGNPARIRLAPVVFRPIQSTSIDRRSGDSASTRGRCSQRVWLSGSG